MGYKCEDEITYNGQRIRTGHCETCKHEHLTKVEYPCRDCINGANPCPMYSYHTGADQCAGCKWEAKE